MQSGVDTESEAQRVERENKQKQDEDARRAEEQPPPPPFRPMGEQSFMQFMQFMQESHNKFMQELIHQVAPARGPEVREANLSEFLKTKPLPFALAPEPLEADDWLMDTERKMAGVNANDDEKVRFATHLLTGAAAAWWDNQMILKPPEKVYSWKEFKEMFKIGRASCRERVCLYV